MATIREKTSKSGAVSYEITVSLGRDVNDKQIRKFHTYKPEPGMTQKQIEKALEREAVLFEEKCRSGEVLDTSTKFCDFAELWLKRKKNTHSQRYQQTAKEKLVRINEALGHKRVSEIKPFHIQSFIDNLQEPGVKKSTASAVSSTLGNIMQERGLSRAALHRLSNVPVSTVSAAARGKAISRENAEKLSTALEMPLNEVFIVNIKKEFLSAETVRYHQRIISTILESAVKWQVIYDNPARRVELPKQKKKEAAYLDDKQALEVLSALSVAPLKWRAAVMLLVYSGMRRGELCGLSWDDVDFENNIIHIRKSSQYLPGVGVSDKATKNESSERVVKLPPDMFTLLQEYRAWQAQERLNSGDLWHLSNKLFCQVSGKPIHPDTITQWVAKFRKSNNLPYFTPHTLRHTSATLLIMQGVPVKAVSARLGHASTNITNKIYSHSIQTVDALASDILGDILKPIIKAQKSG